jgi:esterase/lipase superfamily enzyme
MRVSTSRSWFGIHWAVVALVAFALPGCASRPGPELLAPVAALPGAKTLPIYVATTRERASASENVFTSNRADGLNFAKFVVSVPPSHKPGNVELPSSPPNVQTSFAVVDQAVMSEAEFRNAVAPQSAARRKKHKIFLFVHGFNNNFQESLFRLAQLQADAQIDGIPVLFSWPSQARVAAYAADQDAASYSRDYLVSLLTMLARSPEVSDILVVGHSMGGMLMADALRQLRTEGKNHVFWRPLTSPHQRSVNKSKRSGRSNRLCWFWFPRMTVLSECPACWAAGLLVREHSTFPIRLCRKQR